MDISNQPAESVARQYFEGELTIAQLRSWAYSYAPHISMRDAGFGDSFSDWVSLLLDDLDRTWISREAFNELLRNAIVFLPDREVTVESFLGLQPVPLYTSRARSVTTDNPQLARSIHNSGSVSTYIRSAFSIAGSLWKSTGANAASTTLKALTP